MRISILIWCVAGVAFSGATASNATDYPYPPWHFSRQSTPIWEKMWAGSSEPRSVRIPSPDGKRVVVATFDKQADGLLLSVRVEGKRFSFRAEGGVSSELAWAPDSLAFFLTYSDSGRSGGYHTNVYYVSAAGLKKISLDSIIERTFGNPVLCEGGSSTPNVVGVAWLEGSRRVLVAAQVMPISICDSYGTFKLFEISLPTLTIVKRYDQLAAKKEFWTYLGEDLREARDSCITDPKSCEVPYLHGKTN